MRATPALLALLLAAAAALPALAEGRRAQFDTRVFAAVGTPGYPEPVVIGPDGLVYVGTNNASAGAAAVLVYDLRGRLVRREVIRGQGLTREHGIQGLAFDGSGLLYALDRSAAHSRVIVIDPATGKQRDYATFSDVPLCGAARRRNCSASTVDRSAGPDYATFAPGGALYVTDIDQGLIWKVPRGGGRARVWFTDPLLNSPFGPNGIQFHRDGRTLRFAQTISGAPEDRAAGLLLDLPVKRDGRPGRLRRFWRSRPGDGVDGFAIARSGNVYVALAVGDAVALVSPAGAERRRFPATAADNARLPVPYDGPASLAFRGRRLLITNQSSLRSNPRSWAVFDVWAGERGIALFRPVVAPPARRPRIRLVATVRAGASPGFRRVTFKVTVGRGTRARAVRGARISLAGRTAESDRLGSASLRLPLRLPAHARARASARGLRDGVSTLRT